MITLWMWQQPRALQHATVCIQADVLGDARCAEMLPLTHEIQP